MRKNVLSTTPHTHSKIHSHSGLHSHHTQINMHTQISWDVEIHSRQFKQTWVKQAEEGPWRNLVAKCYPLEFSSTTRWAKWSKMPACANWNLVGLVGVWNGRPLKCRWSNHLNECKNTVARWHSSLIYMHIIWIGWLREQPCGLPYATIWDWTLLSYTQVSPAINAAVAKKWNLSNALAHLEATQDLRTRSTNF